MKVKEVNKLINIKNRRPLQIKKASKPKQIIHNTQKKTYNKIISKLFKIMMFQLSILPKFKIIIIMINRD